MQAAWWKEESVYVGWTASKKGRGLFARCSFEAGQAILVEIPLRASSHCGIAQLIVRDKRYWELAPNFGAPLPKGDRSKSQEIAEAIVNTNAWKVNNQTELYLYVSFCNHSCAPNAILCGATLYTLGPIEAGAEITVSYVPVVELIASKSRRRHLLRGWMLACQCWLCQLKWLTNRQTKSVLRIQAKLETALWNRLLTSHRNSE